jgi:predicted ATPase
LLGPDWSKQMQPPAISDPVPARRLWGRQVEVETLSSRLSALQAGRGGTVLVAGLAGLGKTVLLNAIQAAARDAGITVLPGAGDAAGRVIPFGPLLEAVMSAPDAPDPPVDPAVLRDLSHSPDQRFWLLRELQEALERAARRAPVLISLDDAQWADPATVAALGSLTRRLAAHRILWLIAVRSGEPGASEHAVLSRLEPTDPIAITLGPLDEAAVGGLAADLLGAPPDAALLTALSGVGGHPLLLTELLRGLREEKLVAVRSGSAHLIGTGLPLRFRACVGCQP